MEVRILMKDLESIVKQLKLKILTLEEENLKLKKTIYEMKKYISGL